MRFVILGLSASLAGFVATGAGAGEAKLADCYAQWTEAGLTVGNAAVERTWVLQGGALKAASLRAGAAKTEWLVKPGAKAAGGALAVTASAGRRHPVEAGSLFVEAKAGASVLQIQIFPGVPGMLLSAPVGAPAAADDPAQAAPAASGIESAGPAAAAIPAGPALDELALAPQHLRLTETALLDQTDVRNELRFEREWLLMPNEAPLALQGNVFAVEEPLTGRSLVFLKLAPLPHARPVKAAADLAVTPSKRVVRVPADRYPVAVLACDGGRAGRTAALQAFQRALRPYVPGRDGLFLSNTWGDRNRDSRINETFLLAEVEAGARLGVDVVQIDDGWQKGRSANSAAVAKGKGAWNGYWDADPEFWLPDPVRFPRGLAPVVAAARSKGLKFGLWFGPDSSGGVTNWQRDAGRLLDLHRSDGVDYFKIDSVKATSTLAEDNLHRFFDRVLAESAGKVVFDLDVTAETRPGYFGAPRVGPIFVENRYTDFHRYWPHQTLRSLWSLAHVVDPVRLRIELLNNTRQVEKYPDDPLAPAKWRPDALFATAMMASPLGWFEVSNLPDGYVAAVAPLVAAWRRERGRMHGGTILPVGEAPDGIAWTGLASVAPDRRSAYAVVFRELNADAAWTTAIPLLAPGAAGVTVLGGRGTATVRDGRLAVTIPAPLDFLWVRIDPAR